MTLEAYVKFRVGKISKFTSSQEAIRTIKDIYKEMEAHGHNHTDIFVAINNAIITNIRNLDTKQKKQVKKLIDTNDK